MPTWFQFVDTEAAEKCSNGDAFARNRFLI
jgi:hypothetical protein